MGAGSCGHEDGAPVRVQRVGDDVYSVVRGRQQRGHRSPAPLHVGIPWLRRIRNGGPRQGLQRRVRLRLREGNRCCQGVQRVADSHGVAQAMEHGRDARADGERGCHGVVDQCRGWGGLVETKMLVPTAANSMGPRASGEAIRTAAGSGSLCTRLREPPAVAKLVNAVSAIPVIQRQIQVLLHPLSAAATHHPAVVVVVVGPPPPLR